MNKLTNLGQPLPRKPKQITKTSQISLKINLNSRTPTLKIISNPINLQSFPILRETQSYASSPQHLIEEFKSIRPSPTPKEKCEIEALVKGSLKKFKSEKQELEKIKEIAKNWKETRKKKLEEYNVQTRIENKCKFKCETFRPRSAWGSPELKEPFYEEKHVCVRNSGLTLEKRRANIGLEYYNLKSPRNSTPKILQEKKEKCEKSKKFEEKKELEEFIMKKRKERKKVERVNKEKEEEEEFKRISQLVKVDRAAKKVLKKFKKIGKKKGKILKRTKSKKKLLESSNDLNRINRRSRCYSEDEEVINIMQVRKLKTPEQNSREGRECVIFGNYSSHQSDPSANITEIANKVLEKHHKSQDFSKAASLSMPLIELKSISSDSSSDISEKKLDIQKRLEILKNRMKKAKGLANKSKNEVALEIDIGLDKLASWLKEFRLLGYFYSIKYFEKPEKYVETPQLSVVDMSKKLEQVKNLSEKREELEAMLSKLASHQSASREGSVDMEKLWDNINLTKNTEFFQSPEVLPPSTPVEDEVQMVRTSSGKPSNDPSYSIMDQLRKVHFPSTEFLSFGNIGEATYEDLIDSPSLLSIVSNTSSEEYTSFVIFCPANLPCEKAKGLLEPIKPVFPTGCEILIDDGGLSASITGAVSEFTIAVKESESIATPEAEEIEEFSSIEFDFNFGQKKNPTQVQEISMNPFNISETLELDEDDIIAKVVLLLTKWVFSEAIHAVAYDEYKSVNFQLLGNALLILHQVEVRTGVSAVMNFVEKIWNFALRDEKDFVNIMKSQELTMKILEIVSEYDSGKDLKIVPNGILELAESPSDLSLSLSIGENVSAHVKAHNKMIFDCLNEHLQKIWEKVSPPAWRVGVLFPQAIDVEKIVAEVNLAIRDNCVVAAGRIPSIAMIGENGVLDDTLLQKVRESGLSILLTQDIESKEKTWTNYEIDELQVQSDLAEIILELLLLETEQILSS